jgi:hypothetical protein
MWYVIVFVIGFIVGGGLVWWGKSKAVAELKAQVGKLGG